ncbi:hypothetical protein AB0M86_29325 [Streptomyces sp. NPDC051639]
MTQLHTPYNPLDSSPPDKGPLVRLAGGQRAADFTPAEGVVTLDSGGVR